jgi:hypothetical protein
MHQELMPVLKDVWQFEADEVYTIRPPACAAVEEAAE